MVAASWEQYADWHFRIVREEGVDPVIWHVIVDEPDNQLEVTQCGNGGGQWVDLLDGRELWQLGQVCAECAKGLGQLAAASEGLWLKAER